MVVVKTYIDCASKSVVFVLLRSFESPTKIKGVMSSDVWCAQCGIARTSE